MYVHGVVIFFHFNLKEKIESQKLRDNLHKRKEMKISIVMEQDLYFLPSILTIVLASLFGSIKKINIIY